MKRILVAGVALLVLTGCVQFRGGQDEPEPTREPDPTAACLDVTSGSVEALRVGVKAIQDSNDVGNAAALKIDESVWFVAAEVTGPGMSGTVGLWVTVNDPTASESNAYQSVDGTAAAFSDYVRSPNWNAASPRADSAKSCLE